MVDHLLACESGHLDAVDENDHLLAYGHLDVVDHLLAGHLVDDENDHLLACESAHLDVVDENDHLLACESAHLDVVG